MMVNNVVEKQTQKTKVKVKKTGAFSGRNDGYSDVGCDFSDPIVNVYNRVPIYKATGPNDTDFITDFKVIISDTYNLTERANSFKNDSDVYGIMDKVLKTGDASLLYKEPNAPTYADVHDAPHDLIEAGQAIQAGEMAYNSLDDALKKGASPQYIAENFTQKEIDAYIETLKASKVVVSDNGGVNNE